jgi:hypothetical protein
VVNTPDRGAGHRSRDIRRFALAALAVAAVVGGAAVLVTGRGEDRVRPSDPYPTRGQLIECTRAFSAQQRAPRTALHEAEVTVGPAGRCSVAFYDPELREVRRFTQRPDGRWHARTAAGPPPEPNAKADATGALVPAD